MLMLLALLTSQGPLLADLPLVEARATSPGRTIALVMSGDGDRAVSVKDLTRSLNQAGVCVVGLKSRSYLTSGRRTPENVTADVVRILEAYHTAWQADTVLMIGYSRGADILPFVVNRLPGAWRDRVALLALISGSARASFEFHFTDLITYTERPTDRELAPEVDRMAGPKVLCLFGTGDEHAVCPLLRAGKAQVVSRPGGHHLDKDFEALAALILAAWRAP